MYKGDIMKKSDNQLLNFILESVVYSVIILLIAIVISIYSHKPIISLMPALMACFVSTLIGKLLYNKSNKKN